MDKATAKSSADVFQANRDRAGPLLAKLKADGIGNVIDGKVVHAGGLPKEDDLKRWLQA